MRYLFSPSEMKIAYDMVNTNPIPFGIRRTTVSLASVDSSKIIEWLSKSLKLVLKIPEYQKLSFWGNNSQSTVDRFISLQLLYNALHEKENFPLEYRLYYEHIEVGDGGTCAEYRSYEIFARKMTDEVAIKKFTTFLGTLLKKSHPGLYAPDKSATTLMCINKLCPDSLFAKLPRDVAKIIAKKVLEENKRELTRNCIF